VANTKDGIATKSIESAVPQPSRMARSPSPAFAMLQRRETRLSLQASTAVLLMVALRTQPDAAFGVSDDRP